MHAILDSGAPVDRGWERYGIRMATAASHGAARSIQDRRPAAAARGGGLSAVDIAGSPSCHQETKHGATGNAQRVVTNPGLYVRGTHARGQRPAERAAT